MKLLAVDDDPIILELLSHLVASIGGHEITTAPSAQAALELVRAPHIEPYDCFMLDIQMPVMDGVTLCRHLREFHQHAQTPILMLTAMSDKRYIDDAFRAGATDYITKPFDIAEIKFRLQAAEAHAAAAPLLARKVFAANKVAESAEDTRRKAALADPINIIDVDGVIDYFAFENYISQLSRSALYGSTVFGVAIQGFPELWAESTAFGLECLVTDTAEAISDCLSPHQYLISYAGKGIYVCVVEGGHCPDLGQLADRINMRLYEMDLYFCDGRKLDMTVTTGRPFRLVWRPGHTAIDSIGDAYTTAEEAASHGVRQMAYPERVI